MGLNAEMGLKALLLDVTRNLRTKPVVSPRLSSCLIFPVRVSDAFRFHYPVNLDARIENGKWCTSYLGLTPSYRFSGVDPMDSRLIETGLDFSRKRKKWILHLAVLGVSGYSFLEALPSALFSSKKAAAPEAGRSSSIRRRGHLGLCRSSPRKDLNKFLQSNSDQIKSPTVLSKFRNLSSRMRSRYPPPRPQPPPRGTRHLRSPRCPYLCYSCKGNPLMQEALIQADRAATDGAPSCRHLDGLASRIIHGVVAAFFTALELCSCIVLETEDDSDESGHYLSWVSATKGNEEEDGITGINRDPEG
ncbi:hypothetical protein SAY87_029028 [Trapa incisa]|uniref:Uncharacterized protein n=1 Tax=Trapa incisa TaxID=236973 RepID=A0AAN7KXE4_9MYRT|nr:hypothetical protein SAY87_029028 [Trapa incisa]